MTTRYIVLDAAWFGPKYDAAAQVSRTVGYRGHTLNAAIARAQEEGWETEPVIITVEVKGHECPYCNGTGKAVA